ncbi:MAG: LuxR C-terminal-related transcriptional regulator [Schleiferiaceae bacterium]
MYKLRLLLKHYHAGASTRWMAEVLDISRSTLNVYWATIRKKMSAKLL